MTVSPVYQPPDPVGDRILTGALELLRTRGPGAVTMQAVADATGIAKTTIYRRHRHRRDMMAAALQLLVHQPDMDPHATPEQRLRWAIGQSIEVILHGIGVGGFAALLTNEDPEFSTAFRSLLTTYRAPALAALGCEQAEGETAVDMIVGSYIAEFARTGAVDPDWHDRVFTVLRARLCI